MPRTPLTAVSLDDSRHEDEAAESDVPALVPVTGYARSVSGVQRIELSAEHAAHAAPRPTFMGPDHDSKVVLVVEDDDAVRALIVRTLASRYTVYEAHDGMVAAQMLRAMQPAPHAIVCDVSMPRLDGFTLAKRVKSDPHLRFTAVIFVTARTAALDVVEGINSGARHYVTKPFKMAELLDKVCKVVR
jgi:CheY-like chemotaxis protein